jgi:TetR/AcrR family transcriptional regulator, ethionamide resistance regulator
MAAMPPRTPVHQVASRRKRSKGDLTSQAILDTAERLLESRSLDEIAVDELTSGAGVSRSTFYFHFESREAVLYALSEHVAVELHESAALWLRRGSEPPEDAIRRALTATVALWRQHGPVLRAAMRARDVNPQMQEFWSGVARRFIDSAAEQIERERASGVALPGPPDARLLATVLENMNEQACFTQSLSRRSPARDRKLVDALTTIWLRSVYGITSPNS